MRRWVQPLAVLAALAGTGVGAAPAEKPDAQQKQPSQQKQPTVEPEARAQLQKMSDFLARQQRFTIQTNGSMEIVLETGEKVEYDFASDVRVQRPNMLRTDRRGAMADLSFFYDGRSFTLFGKNKGYYATADAPDNLDDAIDAAREKLGIEAPAADLLYSNTYKILMEDVVSGQDLGMNDINGTPCRHLAFRGNETDWQIWIEDGPRPLPRKFVIVSKKVEGQPEFTVELSQWDLSPQFDNATFRFYPPNNATRIDFLSQMNTARTQGGKK